MSDASQQPPPQLGYRTDPRASWLELFFDLVFVAAVAALADLLHHDHSISGLVVFAALFEPVWWAWMGYTWYATGFGADDRVARIALLAAMCGVAIMAAGVDGAAHGDSGTFVGAYAGLLFLLAALYARAWRRFPEARPLTVRYGIGDALGAALWLASLVLDEGVRPVLWGVAMAVLLLTPVWAVFSLDRTAHDVSHIAERYGLFTIIVLGESVVVTVAGLDVGSSVDAILVALVGFAIAATIWWVYFDRWRAMPGSHQAAGFVWAQGHFFVFAGIAAAAIGVELLIEAAAHSEPLDLDDRLPLGAGLAAYLMAMATIRAATRRADWVVYSRLAAAGVVLALALAGGLEPLALIALSGVAVVGEASIEMLRAPPMASG